MKDIFLNVLEAGLQGSVIIALVLILRLVLKTAPRRIICLLWLVAGIRLLLPFQIESGLSLQPDSRELFQPQAQSEFFQSQPVPAVPEDAELPDDVEIVTGDALADPEPYFEYPVQQPTVRDWRAIAARVWLVGVCAMALYSAGAYVALRRRIRMAVKVSGNIYQCAGLDTAFVLGFFRPRIYLPAENSYVLAHERAHIRRGDHWFKLLGFAALALHWFNPLVWIGYLLLCRDLEMACDEAVVRDMDLTERKAYSAALLACAARRSAIAACPVAFGEVSVKQRIVSVLNYRKPRFWICVIAAAAVLMVAVCFLTSPGGMTKDEALEAFYKEMDALQSSTRLHLSYTVDTESEFDAVELIGQEFWLDGGIWYRTFEYATDEGHFTTCYAEIDGVPYAREYSHDMENFTDRDWQQIPAENSANMPVLTTAWRALEVLEVHRDRTHGGAYVIKLQGDISDAAPTDTYYQKYWDIHLDADGHLLCMHLFTHGAFYMYYADTSGIYESRTYSTLTVEPWDDAWKEELADLEAYQKVYGENADAYAAIDRCQLALEQLQRQEYSHMVVQWTSLEEEVDYHQEYWKNGDDWLYTSRMGDANVAAMELNGLQFLAETFENGEYQWAQTDLKDEDQYKHWLTSFEFDYNNIAFVDRKGGLDGDQSIILNIITGRAGDTVEGYPVTFHLKNGHELVSVEYKAPAQDLNTASGDYPLTATVTILPTDAEESAAAIDQQIKIMRGQIQE